MSNYKILAINPGSTSTKIAVYENENQLMEKTLRHSTDEINKYDKIFDQFEFRKNVIIDALFEEEFAIEEFDAVVGRGGLLKPIKGGTYEVTDKLVKGLKEPFLGEHASNLGGIIAKEIADEALAPSFIVDPVVVDELSEIARISGMPEIPRVSIFHALNQKAIARRYAQEIGKKYEDLNLIVVHLGGGISVGAHEKAKVIDVNNALDGEGPFSPERAGGLPVGELTKMCYSGKYTHAQIKKLLKGEGGLVAYLGTNDARDVQKMIDNGDEKAKLIYEAMAYQVAKEIGSCATVLKGNVDAILITGGIAYSQMITNWIKERVSFISEVKIYPGEDEMSALALGALRVLKGEELPQRYEE